MSILATNHSTVRRLSRSMNELTIKIDLLNGMWIISFPE
jgi:hypothetical protein